MEVSFSTSIVNELGEHYNFNEAYKTVHQKLSARAQGNYTEPHFSAPFSSKPAY